MEEELLHHIDKNINTLNDLLELMEYYIYVFRLIILILYTWFYVCIQWNIRIYMRWYLYFLNVNGTLITRNIAFIHHSKQSFKFINYKINGNQVFLQKI